MTLAQVLRTSFPFAGTINAGPSSWVSPAEEELADTLTFEEWLQLNKEATMMFTVSNDALRDRGIFPQDTVLFERTADANSGDIVIARADGRLVMRIYQQANQAATLLAANPAYPPIQPNDELIILGQVKAVIRRY